MKTYNILPRSCLALLICFAVFLTAFAPRTVFAQTKNDSFDDIDIVALAEKSRRIEAESKVSQSSQDHAALTLTGAASVKASQTRNTAKTSADAEVKTSSSPSQSHRKTRAEWLALARQDQYFVATFATGQGHIVNTEDFYKRVGKPDKILNRGDRILLAWRCSDGAIGILGSAQIYSLSGMIMDGSLYEEP